MRHSDFIKQYELLRSIDHKLQAVKFIKDVVNECQPFANPGNTDYIGLKEAKDLMDNHITGLGVLLEIKSKWPIVYKRINFVSLKELGYII